MVAYNLMLAVFPFALLVLFIFGQVVNSSDIGAQRRARHPASLPEHRAGHAAACDRSVRASSTTIGIAAAVGGIWIGASFWGAMDTAFCRIYHVECRGWVQQKRWSLVMLLALLLLLAASVTVPTVESAVLTSANRPAVRPRPVGAVRTAIVVIGGLLATFLIISAIYWAVPEGPHALALRVAGALFFALVTSAGNSASSPLPQQQHLRPAPDRGTIGFILIALVWFYAISLAMLAGAVINSLQASTQDDTGLSAPRRLVCARRSALADHPRAASAGRGSPARGARCPSASA